MDERTASQLLPDVFIDEYQTLVAELPDPEDTAALASALVTQSAWTPQGADLIIKLARDYGTSILSNALALAAALDIEDGEAGY